MDLMVRQNPYSLAFIDLTSVTTLQEVNPSLADEVSVQQTVAVGCSLLRSALGKSFCAQRLLLLKKKTLQEKLSCDPDHNLVAFL